MILNKIYQRIKLLNRIALAYRPEIIDDFYIKSHTTFNNNASFHGNNRVYNYKIGKNSYVSFNSIIYNCEIGKYCSIGPNVVIGFGDHPKQYVSTNPNIYLNENLVDKKVINNILKNSNKDVIIKNDVWIGANVYIKNGITIGNGAIIGSGSFVNKDVQDFSIVAGVPIKIIGKRFQDDIALIINKIQWWDLDDSILLKYKEILMEPSSKNLNYLLECLGLNK